MVHDVLQSRYTYTARQAQRYGTLLIVSRRSLVQSMGWKCQQDALDRAKVGTTHEYSCYYSWEGYDYVAVEECLTDEPLEACSGSLRHLSERNGRSRCLCDVVRFSDSYHPVVVTTLTITRTAVTIKTGSSATFLVLMLHHAKSGIMT